MSPTEPGSNPLVDADVAETVGSRTARNGASAVDPDPADRAVLAVPEEEILRASVSQEELFESLENLGFEIKQASVLAKDDDSDKDQQ